MLVHTHQFMKHYSHSYQTYIRFVRFGSVVSIRPILIICFNVSLFVFSRCFPSSSKAFYFLQTLDALLHFYTFFYGLTTLPKQRKSWMHTACTNCRIMMRNYWSNKHTYTPLVMILPLQNCFTPAHNPESNSTYSVELARGFFIFFICAFHFYKLDLVRKSFFFILLL